MTTSHALIALLRAKYDELKSTKDEAGYTIETVVVAAGLAVIALAVIVILTAKITSKADSINLG